MNSTMQRKAQQETSRTISSDVRANNAIDNVINLLHDNISTATQAFEKFSGDLAAMGLIADDVPGELAATADSSGHPVGLIRRLNSLNMAVCYLISKLEYEQTRLDVLK